MTKLNRIMHSPRHRVRPNRGIVIVAIIVLLAVSMTLFGIWARRAILEQGRIDTQQHRLQAIRLAEAGIERAVALRMADVKFESETWSVPPTVLDQKHAGEVRIKVESGSSHDLLRFEAAAQFPAGDIRCVQITKTIEISTSISKDPS